MLMSKKKIGFIMEVDVDESQPFVVGDREEKWRSW